MALKVGTGDSNGFSPGAYYRSSPLAVIDVNSEESLSKWEAILRLPRKDLLAAIHDFGPVVRDIRRGLLQSEDKAA